VKHFELISEGIDVSGVLAELEAHPELWNQHTARTRATGTPHKTSSDIWVRYNDVTPFERGARPYSEINDAHIPVWYDGWRKLPSLKPIVFDLMAKVQGEMLCGILITKIPPGGRIEPHVDNSWHVSFTEKFYLSLKSEPGSEFHCDHDGERESLNPKPGEVWLFDNRKVHSVTNNSPTDRITAIICIRTEMFGRIEEERHSCLG